MSRELSAKDKAFEKERVKYRHQIKDLEQLLITKDVTIVELQNKIEEQEAKLREYEDWIERLLSYTEMNKEEFQKLLEEQKKSAELNDSINSFLGIMEHMSGVGMGAMFSNMFK